MGHEKLDKYLENKGLKIKDKQKPSKDFKTLSAKEKDALLEKMARDLGYID